ncbi:MAG: biotin/lipoyl-binding protein [Lachnospiraceae bacterium]|nr:biotin/lipoyl-binding protein [Lachnospiraceae bacterium]
MKKLRAKAGALLACGLSLSSLAGCALLPKEVEERKSPVIATQAPFEYVPDIVQRETIYDQVLLYPKFTELGGASLTFKGRGVVGEIYVKVGDHVKEGEILAEMDYVQETRDQLEELDKALESNEQALAALNRQKEWDVRECDIRRKYKQISKSEYEKQLQSVEEQYASQIQDMEDKISIQKIKKKQMEDKIQDGTIYSTIEGTVSTVRSETVGRYVEPETTFVQVIDASICMFELDTEYAEYFKVGQEVEMEMSSSVILDTVVYSVEGTRVLFKPSGDQIISLNSSSRLFLVLDKRENVLTLSRTSVRYTEDAAYVYVLDDDGFRTLRQIEVGLEGGPSDTSAHTRIEIVSGLEQGDIVIGR